MRRTATDATAGLAGVLLVASFTTLRTVMAAFSAGRPRTWSFGCWELSVMIESQGRHEKAARRGGCGEDAET